MPRTSRTAPTPGRAGIVDVARRAGVSVATVSRALRGLPNVSPNTRDRVVRAAGELEYTASPMASALVTGRTGSVGVIASNVGRWFFAEVLTGLAEGLREQGYDLVLHVLPDADRREAFFGGLPVRRRVDALAVVGLQLDESESTVLHHLGVPIVTVGESLPGLHREGIDNSAAARLAVEYLVSLGHTRIAMIGGEARSGRSAPAQRELGFRSALPAGAEPLLEDGGFTAEGGAAAMTRLLASAPAPTAVFCQSDEMAFGAMNAVRRAGLRVPEDVSIIGLDGHELAGVLDLTTVAQPVREQGVDAGRWLAGELRRPPRDLAMNGRTVDDVHHVPGVHEFPDDAVGIEPPPEPDHLHAVRLIRRGSTVSAGR